jgi:hypothetical protein
MGVFKASVVNEEAAIRNRVLGDVGTINEDTMTFFRDYAHDFCYQHPLHVVPMSRSEWFKTFPLVQRQVMQEEWTKYKNGLYTAEDFSRTSCFVKIELAPMFMNLVIKDNCPRCICACPPMMKPILGPWCRSAMCVLSAEFNYECAEFVEIGRPAEEVGCWFSRYRRKFSVMGKADQHRYDKHEGPEIIETEVDVYEAWGLRGEALRIMRMQQEEVSGRARRGSYFKRSGFRRTGVPNTTLGNTLINLLLYKAYFASIGAKPEQDYAVMVHGDDSIVFMKEGMQSGLVGFAERLGFDLAFEECEFVSQVRYCSNMMYPISPTYWKEQLLEFVPGPTMKALLKMNYTIHNIPPRAFSQHQRGVALGLQAAVRHVPLLNDAVQRTLNSTIGAHGSYLKRARTEAERKIRPTDSYPEGPFAEYFLAEAYSVPVGIIRQCRIDVRNMLSHGLYATPSLQMLTRAVCLTEYS